MRTREILERVYGEGESNSFHTRLADIGERIVTEAAEREDLRLRAAEARQALADQGPLADQAAQRLIQAENEALLDSRLPAVLSYDAYTVMKEASQSDPSDRGLKSASKALYDHWQKDKMGHLTIGEVSAYRAHFKNVFPKSAAKAVFDQEIPAVGFATLGNLSYLTRIASEVTDQASYEGLMESYGLDGDRPEQIRARAYIKSIAELSLSDEPFTFDPPTLVGTSRAALDRVAQELFGEPGPEGEEEHEEAMDPAEADLPHDEYTEEMATIESPVSGEDLVVELGVQDEEHAEGMEPEEGEAASGGSAPPLPESFGATAQLEDGEEPMAEEDEDQGEIMLEPDLGARMHHWHTGQGDPVYQVGSLAYAGMPVPVGLASSALHWLSKDLARFKGAQEDRVELEEICDELSRAIERKERMAQILPGMDEPEAELPEGEGMEMAEEEDSTSTIITDPTSGEELELTLSRVEKEETEEPMKEDEAPDLEHEMQEGHGLEGLEGEEAGMYSAASLKTAKAPKGWEPTVRKMKKDKNIDNPFALSAWMKDKGYKPHAGKEKTAERSFEEATSKVTPTQQGPMTGTRSISHAETQLFSKTPAKKKPKKEEKKATKLTREQVRDVCASLGLTADAIEERLLDGDEIASGAFALRIGSTDEVELRKLVYSDSTKDAKTIRTSSLGDFDGIVSDFMALTAARYATTPIEEVASTKTAAPVEKEASYVVTSDVPQAAPLVARRMMASVWKFVPDAEGEMLDDGRLAVLVHSAQERDINRIATIFASTFGVVNIESQKVVKSASASDSPYRGTTPVAKTPAGMPGKPMQAPMQTPLTGQGAQHDFIARHTDPMKTAEGICECGEEGDHEHEKMAQLEEPGMDGDLEGLYSPGGDMDLDKDRLLSGPPDGLEDGMPPDDMSGMPMGDPMMGGGMGMDPSQAPIDIAMGGQISPEDDQAIKAGMQHFRDMGMGPMEAMAKFSSSYSEIFDKYGETGSPQRSMAEAAAFKALTEAFSRPAAIPAKSSKAAAGQEGTWGHAVVDGKDKQVFIPEVKMEYGLPEYVYAPLRGYGHVEAVLDHQGNCVGWAEKAKQASLKAATLDPPRPTTQHPGKVKVKKDWKMGDLPKTPAVPVQQGPMDGVHPDTDIGIGDQSDHSWGGNKKPGAPQKGSKIRQPGTVYPSTEVFEGTDGSGESAFGSKLDALSKKAPHTHRSADFVVSFDPDLGDTHLRQGEKQIAVHASMNEALAHAERLAFGTDLRVLIDDGQGGLEDAATGQLV